MVENLILPGIPKIYFLLGVKVASRKAYRIRDHLAILGRPLNVALFIAYLLKYHNFHDTLNFIKNFDRNSESRSIIEST